MFAMTKGDISRRRIDKLIGSIQTILSSYFRKPEPIEFVAASIIIVVVMNRVCSGWDKCSFRNWCSVRQNKVLQGKSG